ncbi:hypothetical protein VNO77_01324 [Canavalia gladiata]|uniref:Uncharacterized protein n=1 Tax=Canavalia gladiata TaxID=3824 RepID=A0AAN9MRN3_CANGL
MARMNGTLIKEGGHEVIRPSLLTSFWCPLEWGALPESDVLRQLTSSVFCANHNGFLSLSLLLCPTLHKCYSNNNHKITFPCSIALSELIIKEVGGLLGDNATSVPLSGFQFCLEKSGKEHLSVPLVRRELFVAGCAALP